MIRFACPGCKRVLSGQDEQAGKVVTCPKCGQRMQAPKHSQMARKKPTRRKRRRLIPRIVLTGALLLALAGGGGWVWMHFFNREPAPTRVASRSTSRDSTGEPPVAPPQKQKTEKPPAPPQENKQKTSEPPVVPQQKQKRSEPPDPPEKKPPPPVQEKKEIDLVDESPPELLFDLVAEINVHRTKAGVEPIFLDTELSRPCQSRAEQLARHSGQSVSGAADGNPNNLAAAEAAPLAAVKQWLDDPKRRTAILDPRLRVFGVGFAHNIEGQWISVFDWTRGLDREALLETSPISGAIVYPAPGQKRVPLWFPGNETPDPLPHTKEKLAGYPITLMFPPRARIQEAVAHLRNPDGDTPLWLSSPEKPANPDLGELQQNTICLIAKKPLQPDTRYRVEVSARVNDAAWSAKWDFTTLSEGEIHQKMAGSFLRSLNRLRRHAGLPPVPLQAERSKACAGHAHYLSRNAPGNPALNWNEEKPDLPGYTAEGAAMARQAAIQGGGGPSEAVSGLIDSLISRPQLLDPRLSEVGLGYAPFAQGGWLWVIDLHRAASGKGGEADGAEKEYFYPAPDQENVPLIYPPNEEPSPIPASDARGAETGSTRRIAGYAITVLFGPRVRVTKATAKLIDDKKGEVEGWLSSPEKPAIAGFSQHSLCFLPKAPLHPGTRYTATFQAEVNDRPWRRTWSFTTLMEPNRYAEDLDEKVLVQVNAVRKATGLPPVRLDTELSRGCQSHARYLSLNPRHPATQGMGIHRQDAILPGASPEGARAAKESDIAVVLDPQTCVENWMATLYHRIPILAPNLERVGFAHARIQGYKWVCVLDTGNGRKPQGRSQTKPPFGREP